MQENDPRSLSDATSLDELVEIFESRDLGDEWETMTPTSFAVDLASQRHLVALDDDVVERLSTLARAKHLSFEVLANLFLREKLAEAG